MYRYASTSRNGYKVKSFFFAPQAAIILHMKKMDQYKKEIRELLMAIETDKEAKMILKDLFTPSEVEAMAVRWQLVQSLAEGKSQRQVAKEFGVSISKVTRAAAWLRGSTGFRYFLKKMGKRS